MGNFLAIIGALGVVAALVMFFVRLIAKKGLGYKQLGILTVASVLLFFVGAGIEGSSPEFQKKLEEKKKKQAEIAAEQALEAAKDDENMKDNRGAALEADFSDEETVETSEGAGNGSVSGNVVLGGKHTGASGNKDNLKSMIETSKAKEGKSREKGNNKSKKMDVNNHGKKIMDLTKELLKFAIVEDIIVHNENGKAWAEVRTTEKKDWDDGGWCEDIAKLVILNAWMENVVYLDEVRVFNVDGLQIASMRNWLPRE